jgi:ribosomal protein L5
MNSAELVNLILEKLRRVKFVAINQNDGFGGVRFTWGFKDYIAIPSIDSYVHVYPLPLGMDSNMYTERIEAMLNGKVRNEDGELVQP